MLLLSFHGAMIADGYHGCAGDLLARVQTIAGPTAVVGAELDPHCHVSAAVVAHAADAFVSFNTSAACSARHSSASRLSRGAATRLQGWTLLE